MTPPLVNGHQSPGLWHGRVEKRSNHRKQPIGAFDERHVRRAREHGELGIREACNIASHAAAEQSKHLDSVLGADDIGIPDHDQGGRLDRLNGLGRPIQGSPDPVASLWREAGANLPDLAPSWRILLGTGTQRRLRA
jgi:hypothetical protein